MNISRLYPSIPRKTLRVYWWRYNYPSKLNFGDEITPLIIDRLWNKRSVWAAPDDCQISGAGSILEILQQSSGSNVINVWGSGYISEGQKNTNNNLLFHAVRGLYTLSRIDNTQVALGDPGLLVSRAFPMKRKITYKIGIIPHYVDGNDIRIKNLENRNDIKIINALDDPIKVAKNINSCAIIFSSSLHGLIFSDSYGVPNFRIKLSDNLTGGNYKFDDYYSVKGNAAQLADISKITSQDYVDSLLEDYKQMENLHEIQDGLYKSFPF